ncbi:hypothetical protein NKR23_g10842 [Pleurostoma richardsiae]|uniref:Uncharacterized protein n=1 Tax=Pleurostoma richardsiae TaxID=41990 RepID=A0AA38R929_9PEZI|nr:hypothetical protein NKR23_g10842 [Pleurostoma richardsiae]
MPGQPKVFLVTGCSSGLGYHLSKAVLAAGHTLIATSRDPTRVPNAVIAEVERLGGHWAPLDVTSPNLEAHLHAALAAHSAGRLDVLINNAGVALAATVEDGDTASARRIFETNFFGPLRLARAVVPLMRASPSGGTIVNISSGSSLDPVPLLGVYAASKYAVEGLTESLRAEVAPFGIRVLLAQPGSMRTGFGGHAWEVPLSEAYKDTVTEAVLGVLKGMEGKEAIDPAMAARRIVEAVDGIGDFEGRGEKLFRIPLGSEILTAIKRRMALFYEVLDLGDIAYSVDFEK